MSKYLSIGLFVFVFFPMGRSVSVGLSAETSKSNDSLSICGDVEIWNPQDKDATRLKKCSVVEGYVRLMEVDAGEDFVFPDLREITGYLMVFRVRGFDSLGRVFPKLGVIRGNVLFANFALIITESFDLKTIGLTSLSHIVKGKVWIASNVNLCYVTTVDWDSIVRDSRKHYLEGNKSPNECPVCRNCTKSPTGKTSCWNSTSCQATACPSTCPNNCYNETTCCHEHCLGGCSGDKADNCYSCKHYRLAGKCVKSCPAGTYVYAGWRCTNESECYGFPKTPSNNHWKPHDGQCVLDCPFGYHEQEVYIGGAKRFQCQKCEGGFCRKECNGASIKNKNDSVLMSGCTVVRGSVVISLSGSGKDIISELENNLNTVEEITGLLKITDSYQLTSLNFLKNLKYIHGNERYKSKYSLVVEGNKNLKLLWDFDNKRTKLKINGLVYFGNNPKLCVNVIQQLLDKADIPASDAFYPNMTNGVKSVCDLKNLTTSYINVTSNAVNITWKAEYHDLRKVMGYVIYIKETIFKNVTVFDGRNECGRGGWTVYDVDGSEAEYKIVSVKPYTSYAFYVETVTINADFGAKSEIKYFNTLPGIPNPPSYVNVITNSSSELVITWPPPLEPNGNLSHYLLSIYELDDKSTLNNAVENHCEGKDAYFVPSNSTRYSGSSDRFNHYLDRHFTSQLSDEEKARQTQVAMLIEDKMNNYIYVKNPKRPKRDTIFVKEAEPVISNHTLQETTVKTQIDHSNKTQYKTNYTPVSENQNLPIIQRDDTIKKVILDHEKIDKSITLKTVKNLKHFTKYRVEVQACRQRTQKELDSSLDHHCSDSASELIKTCPSVTADSIPNESLSPKVLNENPGTVELKWEIPKDPNGIVLLYTVEYRRSGYNPITEIVSQKEFLKSNSVYILKKLRPGNYSVRVRASSSSGVGPYTTSKYFYIKDDSSIHSYIYLILGTLLFILPPAIAYCVYYLRKTEKNKLFISVNPEYSHKTYVTDAWEIPRNHIDLIKEIGQGSFGMVYEGLLNSKPCAVKTVNTQASDGEKKEFLNEASVMKAFDTYHVVKLLGVVSLGEPVYVVMELMPNGDLKSFLRSHRPDVCDPHLRPPSVRRLLQMSAEIADGMAYLSAKKYVHRDLAARNCMVAENLTVKIGDFGMARDIYIGDYYRKGTRGLMPVRWMAPESLRDGIFLSASDVWSYGVVLYEMVTLAAQPYQGLTNDQVLRYIMDGGVMERPENCSDKMFDLMRRCWRQNPGDRPGFLEIVETLHQDVSLNFHAVSFYDSDQGKQHRRLIELNIQSSNKPF